MLHRASILICAVLVSTSPVTAQGRQTANADTVRFSLISQCSTERTRPRTPAEWAKLAAEEGLKQKDRDSPWSLVTASGEVRAIPFFNDKETSYWIMFFPASPEPVPDAVLSHLLKDARYSNVDGDTMEIGIAPLEALPGGGTKAKNITISLTGGRLIASRTMIEWK